MPDDINYELELNTHRQTFNTARGDLGRMMKPDQASELIGHANGFGLEETRRALEDDPGMFNFKPLDAERIDAMMKPVEQAYASSLAMDEVVSRRELQARRADPSRPVHMIDGGREFIIDVGGGQIRYLDNGEVKTVDLRSKATFDRKDEREQDDDTRDRDE